MHLRPAWNLVRHAIAGLLLVSTLAAPLRAAPPLSFNKDVRPILSDKCFRCHGPDQEDREADLRLDTRSGASYVIEPGDAEGSELYARISSEDEDLRMPPAHSRKELSADEIAVIKRWLDEGAVYERHWSYVPPRRPEVPAVKDTAWPRGDIDRFLLRRWEEQGLAPSPAADPVTLARRLYLDLLGLPPTPEEAAQLRDPADQRQYEALVDRLLASEHFGERMATYWLDLVRYADSVGYHGDQEQAITPYRDYVIKSFNDNKPFDRFTIEQIAGDLLPDATVEQIVASGYNRLLQTSHEGGVQKKEYLAKYSADRVRNVSSVWMGATMGCAECHNHKYDPYTQRDFYSLAAFFADVDDMRTFDGGNTIVTARRPEMDVIPPIAQARIDALEKRLAGLRRPEDDGPRATAGEQAEPEAAIDQTDDSERGDSERGETERDRPDCDKTRGVADQGASVSARMEALQREIARLKAERRRTMITEAVEPRPIRVLPRGDWLDDSGPVVAPAVPEFLPPLEVEGRRASRLDLARWLTRSDHPQTSRVMVNRLWYLLFGVGLAESLDDHGSQGAAPNHPELLDYLAVEFVESGWDVKQLVKRIVLSNAYRQSSAVSESLRETDPHNLLFARQTRRRLPAESIRDSVLRISGLLDETVGGDSSRPYQPEGYYRHLNFPTRTYESDRDERQYRRGVYVHWQRQFLHPMLLAFDAPTREECTAKRPISNTPTAALTMLNDPTFVEAARVFAQRVIRRGGPSAERRIDWAWRQALTRPPQPREVRLLDALREAAAAEFAEDELAAERLVSVGLSPVPDDIDVAELAEWTMVCRAVFNLSELITRN